MGLQRETSSPPLLCVTTSSACQGVVTYKWVGAGQGLRGDSSISDSAIITWDSLKSLWLPNSVSLVWLSLAFWLLHLVYLTGTFSHSFPSGNSGNPELWKTLLLYFPTNILLPSPPFTHTHTHTHTQRLLEWGAIAFSEQDENLKIKRSYQTHSHNIHSKISGLVRFLRRSNYSQPGYIVVL